MKLPFTNPDVEPVQEGEPRVIGVGDNQISNVMDAISSETARELLSAVYADPATPSELAQRTDQSIQITSYHLHQLEEADLVTVADTVYSDRGREMNIYAPPDDPVVIFIGTEERKQGILDVFKRLFATGIVLIAATVYVFTKTFGYSSGPPGSRMPPHTILSISFVAFFLGGLLVLAVLTLWSLWSLRPSP